MPAHGIIEVILSLFTFGVSNLVLMFIINKQTGHYFLQHGFKPTVEGMDAACPKWDVSTSLEAPAASA